MVLIPLLKLPFSAKKLAAFVQISNNLNANYYHLIESVIVRALRTARRRLVAVIPPRRLPYTIPIELSAACSKASA
jgi:hypothetical protein